MRDITRADRARAAFLQASESVDSHFEGLETLLDLYTLLVLAKGKQCTEEDVRHAWRVTGLRIGPERVGWFDNIEGGVVRDEGSFALDDRIAIQNAAALLEEEGSDNVEPLPARRNTDSPGGAR